MGATERKSKLEIRNSRRFSSFDFRISIIPFPEASDMKNHVAPTAKAA
jgi:hypothetical protein